MNSGKNRLFLVAAFLIVGLTATYWNHFDNGFYFDDIHTIVNNEYIRSLEYVPEYFTNIETFGTMPNNRGYRPMVTLLNAIDYRLGGNTLDPITFHISIWFWYLVQGILLFVFLKNLFASMTSDRNSKMGALLTTGFYMFHTANAETVNYIISRSDSFSTTMMLAGLVLYQYERTRKFQIHLLPFIVALFTKEVSFMYVPLIALYHFFIIEKATLLDLKLKEGWKKIGSTFLSILPAALVGTGLILMNLLYMTDPSRITGGLAYPRWDYFISQFEVVGHYLANFILPIDLSVDPDFKATPEFNRAKMIGFLVIAILHAIGIFSLTKKLLVPIGLGIAWFFVCLVPTSTINPLYQVANEHRVFLPYIGLCLSVGWAAYLLYIRSAAMKKAVLVLTFLVLAGHAYGTYQRNEVWGTADSLWYDATIKSPNNGRGLMNYGLVLMRDGDYSGAEPYFQKAVELLPYWPYSNINMAILKGEMGKASEAIRYFDAAKLYGADNPESYYYYARWHYQKGNMEDAMALVEKGHQVSPKHLNLNELRATLQELGITPEDKAERLHQLAENNPNADNYLNLSLALYNLTDYQGCVRACKKSLEFNPEYALAYNNMCSAYNKLQEWKLAAEACENALRINPNFERAKNNLTWAKSNL